jgi:hypothetical protein
MATLRGLATAIVFGSIGLTGVVLDGAQMPSVKIERKDPAAHTTAYQIVEWSVDPGRSYDNPFDDAQIAVDATFTGPGGQKLLVPGFWSADCKPQVGPDGIERWVETGPGQFLIRACFPVPGEWVLQVSARDKGGVRQSDRITFHVDASQDPGFIRRSPDSDRYLQFDSGKPYFAVGLNIGWPGKRGSADNAEWFAHLSAAGGNFARVWLCWHRDKIESRKSGAGRYDLGACAYNDRMLKLAAENHIACTLTFLNHTQLLDTTYWGRGDWPDEPYNAANGGPATRPVNFFDAGMARTLFKRRLRYIVARYGAFTNVLAWELWNEQELGKVDIPLDWTREMAAELHKLDPYHHLVTTSFGGEGDAATWSLPEIDLTQRHLYGDNGSLQDTVAAYAQAARGNDRYQKPYLLAELGIAWQDPDTKYDPAGQATNLHNGLWAGALSGGFGGGCSWWWDSYVAPKNLWGTYTGLARFAAKVDWPRRKFQPLSVRWPRFPQTQPATWTDQHIPVAGVWGKAEGKPITLDPASGPPSPLPGFLYGPQKPDLRVPTILKVDVPNACEMIVTVAEVSTSATLHIAVDGKSAGDFPFDAQPGGKGQISATQQAQYHNWVAKFDRKCVVELSPGKHEIALDAIAGDWLRIASMTITRSRSSLISDVRPLALQDAATGETIAWLADVNSNWYADLHGSQPRTYDTIQLVLPVPREGKYRIEWWDTRQGQIVQRQTALAEDGALKLQPPPFARDIALRALPAD